MGAVLDKNRDILGTEFGKVQVSIAEMIAQKLLSKSAKVHQCGYREAAFLEEVASVII